MLAPGTPCFVFYIGAWVPGIIERWSEPQHLYSVRVEHWGSINRWASEIHTVEQHTLYLLAL